MSAIRTNSITESAGTSQVSVTPKESEENLQTEQVKTEAGAEGDFESYLSSLLGRTGQEEVSEEELFSSVISQRLNAKDQEAAAFYDQKVKELSVSMARSDGYVPLEDVSKAALQATVEAGQVSAEDAEMINAEAFASAQLDENADCLFDGRGETTAVASMEEAMFKVKEILAQVDAGTLTLNPLSLTAPSNVGMTPGYMLGEGYAGREGLDGVEGLEASGELLEGEGSEKQIRFTWKHEASDGNLAILLPTRLNGQIDGVSLFDSDGNLLEKGDYSKQTGDKRAVFRFDEHGGEYGKDVDAVVYLENGQTLTYRVNNGNERTYVPQDDFIKRSVAQLESDMKKKRGGDAIVPTDSTDSSDSIDSSVTVVADTSSTSSTSGADSSGSGLNQSSAL